jgi:hypothetical protein
MSKQTLWLLGVFAGISFMFLFAGTGGSPSLPSLLAQVGITVGVPSNPYNTLAAQLGQQQNQLNQQAADLAAREAAFTSSTADVANASSPEVSYLGYAVIVVSLLVFVNFYLDWRRSRRAKAVPLPPVGTDGSI